MKCGNDSGLCDPNPNPHLQNIHQIQLVKSVSFLKPGRNGGKKKYPSLSTVRLSSVFLKDGNQKLSFLLQSVHLLVEVVLSAMCTHRDLMAIKCSVWELKRSFGHSCWQDTCIIEEIVL